MVPCKYKDSDEKHYWKAWQQWSYARYDGTHFLADRLREDHGISWQVMLTEPGYMGQQIGLLFMAVAAYYHMPVKLGGPSCLAYEAMCPGDYTDARNKN